MNLHFLTSHETVGAGNLGGLLMNFPCMQFLPVFFFPSKRRIYESIYTVIWKILGLASIPFPSQTPPHSSQANDWSQGAVDMGGGEYP